jgi:hypothetical protein
MSGVAVPTANDSVCMYGHTAGTAGNDLKVEVIDSGGVGPVTYTYNAAGTKLTIDYDGLTPAASVVTVGVNAAAGAIRAFDVGTGAVNWTATVVETDLFGGSTACPALTTTDWGAGTGLTAPDIEPRTFLAGVGAIAAVNTTFTDVLGIDALTLVGSKAIPGDKLIIWNGANKGCYEIDTIPSDTVLTVTETFSAVQANCLYTIMGTASEYGHLAADLISPGTDGDNFSIVLAKNNAGTDIDVSIQVLEDSGATTILERFYDLSPIPTNANYVQNIVNSDSEWADLDLFPQTIKCTGTGNSTAGDATFTDTAGVPATFVDDGVEAGNLFICTSATNAADIRVFEITSVTDNTHLEVNVNFAGTQADVVYTIVGDDTTGAELLGLLASDVTITFGGGVDDVPAKSHYEGTALARTGVYGIDNIPITSRPRKLWVPDAPIVVDGAGVDATDSLNIAMASFCTSRVYLRYAYGNERGQTPAQMLVAVAADAMDSKYATEYVNWVKVSDPLTGNYKWTSPVGAMMGQADLFSAGAEGLVAPVANQPLLGVLDVENEIGDYEELLNNAHLNVIVKFNGIRNMGDYVRTSDTEWKWLHKRDVTIVTMQSIKNSLAQWANWQVKSLKTLGKIRKAVMGYLRKYDMRDVPIGGRFLNATDPSAEPYYVTCDTTNNDLGEPGIIVEIGFSIPEAVEEVTLRYGLWDGSVTVEEV